MRLCYFVPEFPGQTHSFFWQEICSLRKAGIDLVIASSKKPPNTAGSRHSWSGAASAETLYAYPPVFGNLQDIRQLRSLRFTSLLKILKTILCSPDVQHRERLALLQLLMLAVWFGAHLKTLKIEHIHTHFQYRGADLVCFTGLLFGIDYSISRHAASYGFGNQQLKWQNAAFGIAVTQTMRREIAAELPDLTIPIYVAAMGVDTDFFRRSSAVQLVSPDSPVFQVFCCSRLHPAKGYGDLLMAVLSLKTAGIAIELRIAGEDEAAGLGYRLTLQQQIDTLGLADHVTLLGLSSQNQIRLELERCHVFALPSKDEAIGVAFMEAMAMATVVIGCDTGGVGELIQDGKTGLLIEVGNPEALAAALRSVMTNPDWCQRIGRAARQHILANFQIENRSQVLLDALERSAIS